MTKKIPRGGHADDSVLAMPQQLAAGTTIVEETIVSQQAARRQTSRPQQS